MQENSKNTALKCLWILGDQMMHFLLQTSVIIADFPFLSLLAAADATVPLLDYKHRKAFLGSHDFQEEERFNMTFFASASMMHCSSISTPTFRVAAAALRFCNHIITYLFPKRPRLRPRHSQHGNEKLPSFH